MQGAGINARASGSSSLYWSAIVGQLAVLGGLPVDAKEDVAALAAGVVAALSEGIVDGLVSAPSLPTASEVSLVDALKRAATIAPPAGQMMIATTTNEPNTPQITCKSRASDRCAADRSGVSVAFGSFALTRRKS
jgi:hypothetical protein